MESGQSALNVETGTQRTLHTRGEHGTAVEIQNVSKYYKRFAFSRQFLTLKSALLKGDLFTMLRPREVLTALENITLKIPRGTTVGIIGPNGSGKSTLLKLIAGILKPSRGTIRVNGKISALIELGAGFHPELTGKENIVINGIMLGLSKAEILDRMDDIIRFAELEDFVDAPVRTYSSGMFMRLGFSVAVHVEPEILLIDEVLAVGDEAFAHKCLERMLYFKKTGKTIILVTHALGMVEAFCDVAVWLKQGHIQKVGDPHEITGYYRLDVAQVESNRLSQETLTAKSESTAPSEEVIQASQALEEATSNLIPQDPLAPRRWGDQTIHIERVEFLDKNKLPTQVIPSGSSLHIRLHITAEESLNDFVFGFGVFAADGTHIYGSNTNIEKLQPRRIEQGSHVIELTLNHVELLEGLYYLDVAAHKIDGYPYDYHHGMYRFRVYNNLSEVGVIRLPHQWKFDRGVEFKTSG